MRYVIKFEGTNGTHQIDDPEFYLTKKFGEAVKEIDIDQQTMVIELSDEDALDLLKGGYTLKGQPAGFIPN